MSENLSERVEFFRRSIQQMIDSRAEPSYDLLRSLLVEDERLAEWERRTGTAPQRPKADPKKDVCPNCGEVANGCNYCRKTPAPVPQTEGECPQCGGDGKGPLTHHFGEPCPTCDGGGAATAAGVADADLEAAAMEISVKATRLDPETYKVPDKLIWMLRSALFPNEDMERIKSPGPYAKAFRERVCPVPEFPGIRKEES